MCANRNGKPAPRGAGTGHDEKEDSRDLVRLDSEAERNLGLRLAEVRRRPVWREIRATAVIGPNEYALAHVSPRIAGRAVRVYAALGDDVKEGEILADLDSLELGEKKARYLEARANLEVARRNFRREKRLYEKKISSEREFLEAKGAFERAEAAYQAAYEALRLLGLSDEEIEKLEWGPRGRPLSYFSLTSPLAGTVIARHITVGELVTPADRPFTVADLSVVWILLDVYEKDLRHVAVGQTVRIEVDALPGETFQGSVTYVSNVLDPETRTAKARVEIPNADRRLRPGMFARAMVQVPDPSRPVALAVPEEAIQRVDGKPVVFVVEGSGLYRARRVQAGRKSAGLVEILRGLEEGERVVTRGAFYLKSELLEEQMGEHGH
ncbi:MAG: RND transporter [Candidatus Binatia bacterium]|nr:MAG: RND transporter [Candidatus Binatia bacterium]